MAGEKSAGKARGYSLWIVPSGSLRKRLAKAISGLAKEHHGHVFDPHVTLLGGIDRNPEEILPKVAELSKKIRPFTVTLGKADYEERFFRCLFVRALGTSELMVLGQKARAIFGIKSRNRYAPHMSLFYGRLPRRKGESISSGIRNEFYGEKFEAKAIRVMRTTGPAESWKKVRDFRLK